MNKNNATKLKLLVCLISVCVTLLFAVIIPFHHHSDNLNHNDNCAICAIAHQSFTALQVSSLLNVVLAVFLIVVARSVVVRLSHIQNLHLRSPPVA